MTATITGARALTDAEVAMINDIKDLGRVIAHELDDVETSGGDPRWLAIARTHLQQGLMALERAVAKPEGF